MATTLAANVHLPGYRPGDFATTRTGYPVLYEVLSVQEADGLLRVRGLNWAPGYSALVEHDELRPVGSLLAS